VNSGATSSTVGKSGVCVCGTEWSLGARNVQAQLVLSVRDAGREALAPRGRCVIICASMSATLAKTVLHAHLGAGQQLIEQTKKWTFYHLTT
jgi:hypothetical protein